MNEQLYAKYSECLNYMRLNSWLYQSTGDCFYLEKHSEYSKRLEDIMVEINGDWKRLESDNCMHEWEHVKENNTYPYGYDVDYYSCKNFGAHKNSCK